METLESRYRTRWTRAQERAVAPDAGPPEAVVAVFAELRDRDGVATWDDVMERWDALGLEGRQRVLRGLGVAEERRAVEHVIRVFEGDPALLEEAAEALWMMGGPRAYAFLCSQVEHGLASAGSPTPAWTHAFFALTSIGEDDEQALALFERIASDPAIAPGFRARALEQIGVRLDPSDGEHVPLTQRCVDTVLNCLDDPEPEVRFWALYAVGVLPLRAALAKVRTMVSDPGVVPDMWSVGLEAQDVVQALTRGTWPFREPGSGRVFPDEPPPATPA